MIDPNFVMKQGSMLDEYIRDNARLHQRIAELKEELEIKNAIIERWEEEFDHMASQEFFEEIEIISEGGGDAV